MEKGEGLESPSCSYKPAGWHKIVVSTCSFCLDIWVVAAFVDTLMKPTFYLSNATCGDGLVWEPNF